MAANNTQDKPASQGTEFTISNRDVIRLHWKVIALMATALIFLGTYFASGVVNSPHNRIDKLVQELGTFRAETTEKYNHLHFDVDELKENVLQTERNDKDCEKNNTRQQVEIDMLKKMGGECVNWRYEAQQQILKLDDLYKLYLYKERLPD